MNMLCGRWLMALLMGVTVASTADTIKSPDLETSQMQILPPDAHCKISVSNPVVDYGVMSSWQLEYIGDRLVSPGRRSLTVTAMCPYSSTIILLVDGEAREGIFRYGEYGSTRLHLLDAQLDGKAVELRTITPAGVITESGGDGLELNAGQRLAPVIQGRLAEGKTLTVRLEIQPVLAEGDARVSSQQHSETMLTMTLDD